MKLHSLSPSSAVRMATAAVLVSMALAGCTVVVSTSTPTTLPSRTAPPPRRDPATAPSAAAGWTGTYRSVLPCPDCAGLKVQLSLYKDATYDLLTQELGTSKPASSRRGGFTFNADETRITLDANGLGRSFDILPPDRLRMLGKDGQPVSGPDAYRFILKK